MSRILLVDAGNSSIKWAFLQNHSLSVQQREFYRRQEPVQVFENLIRKNQDSCDAVVMVSVLGDKFKQAASHLAKKYSLKFLQVKSQKFLAGITNAYTEPHKLGADRLLAMIAAYHLNNKRQTDRKACIIIDSGTATTIDAVDPQGNHLGGLILPGVDLCSRSLLQNTQQLQAWAEPENQMKRQASVFSSNTADAIANASIYGLAGAIEHICLKMEKQIKASDNFAVNSINKFICGGAAEFLLPYLDGEYQLEKNLLMQGLQIISEIHYA